MKNANKIKYQAIKYYEVPHIFYTKEGDELPYFLEHITSGRLYKEYIEDTDDDYYIQLLNLNKKGGDTRDNDE